MSIDARETTEKTIGDNVFVVKTYATARETNAIQQAYFKGAKVEIIGEQPKISDFNPSVQFEVEKELVAQLVVSMNGTTERVVDRCLDLQSSLYRELIQALDEIASAKKKT